MNKLFKKLLFVAVFLAQSNAIYTGPQEIVNEVKQVIQSDKYYWVEVASALAIATGGVIGSAEYHANGINCMKLSEKLKSAGLLASGAFLLAQTQGPWCALGAALLGVAGAYYGTKPTTPAIEFEI